MFPFDDVIMDTYGFQQTDNEVMMAMIDFKVSVTSSNQNTERITNYIRNYPSLLRKKDIWKIIQVIATHLLE